MTTTALARLKITLEGVMPPIWRRVEVPLNLRLDRLHLVIQAAMGWTNSHLYEFRAGQKAWGLPDPGDGDRPVDARKGRLTDALNASGTTALEYIYDFGDYWAHIVEVEKTGEAESGVVYPRLVDAARRCPPEDCGGVGGYEELLAALDDPKHEMHETLSEWIGGKFDPDNAQPRNLAKDVEALASRWARAGAKRKRVQ
jgi:hypothetical protein